MTDDSSLTSQRSSQLCLKLRANNRYAPKLHTPGEGSGHRTLYLGGPHRALSPWRLGAPFHTGNNQAYSVPLLHHKATLMSLLHRCKG